jgi:hypothetical protein
MVLHDITRDLLSNSFSGFDEKFRDVETFDPAIPKDQFLNSAGKEGYRLLAYLSSLYNNTHIISVGSSIEAALALSYNDSNSVFWMDLENTKSPVVDRRPNIKHFVANVFDDETQDVWEDILKNSAIIYVNVSPLTGTAEYLLYEYFKRINYKGIILFDNVWVNEDMRNNLWYKIPDEYRYDLTDAGHYTGSCVVTFNPNITFPKYDVSNWTLVTAYFNLTKCPDASAEIKARDFKYYMNHARGTLSLPHNLVIYCDKDSYDAIYEIRPAMYRGKTKYVIREFDDLKMKKNGYLLDKTFKDYRDIINNNRKEHPYNFDNRNTASYYLFCMSRYLMLKETIEDNPFKSSHFCWINFCIQRMTFKNLIRLDEALATNRDKFSTCYIDHIPKWLIDNDVEYYRWGRCSMCSGFFTGNAYYMSKVCDLIENKFLYYLVKKLGHADEQLFSPVYFDNPELFEHYYGDYFTMVTDYKYIYEAPEAPIHNFIRNSFNNGYYEKCYEACKFVFKSFALGKCDLSADYKNMLYNYFMECKRILKDF